MPLFEYVKTNILCHTPLNLVNLASPKWVNELTPWEMFLPLQLRDWVAIWSDLQIPADRCKHWSCNSSCSKEMWQAKEQECSKLYHNPTFTSELCTLWDDVFAVFCYLVSHDCHVVRAFALDANPRATGGFQFFLCPPFLMYADDCRELAERSQIGWQQCLDRPSCWFAHDAFKKVHQVRW